MGSAVICGCGDNEDWLGQAWEHYVLSGGGKEWHTYNQERNYLQPQYGEV